MDFGLRADSGVAFPGCAVLFRAGVAAGWVADRGCRCWRYARAAAGLAGYVRAARSPEGDELGWLPGFRSGGSGWWARWRLAAGSIVWVLAGGLGCAGSGMVCVGGIRGGGAFVLLPGSGRCLAFLF
jgi:hypothetical protein